MKNIICPQCRKDTRQHKHGKTASGSQRYICMHCKKAYTPAPKRKSYDDEFRLSAVKLYMEGNSSQKVGEMLGVSKNVCLNWVKRYADVKDSGKRKNERIDVLGIKETK